MWLSMARGSCLYIWETHLVLALGDISPGQDLLQCQQRLLAQRLGGAVLLMQEQRFPYPSTKTLYKEEEYRGKAVAHVY